MKLFYHPLKENNFLKSTSHNNILEINEKENENENENEREREKERESVECKVCREQPQLQAVFGFSQIFWMLCFSSVFVYGK